MSVLQTVQTVQKNNRQFTYGQTVQKKQQTIYIWTDSAKKTTDNLHMDRQCKKLHWSITVLQTVQKNNNSNLHMDRQCKKQQQFTYGQTVQKKQQTIYIWTDSAKNCTGAFTVLQTVQKNNNSNLHMDRQCKKATAIYIWTVHIYRLYRRQCAKYTYIYSVHIVYYKDILNYQRHIIHRMGAYALCTVSIHNVVYA